MILVFCKLKVSGQSPYDSTIYKNCSALTDSSLKSITVNDITFNYYFVSKSYRVTHSNRNSYEGTIIVRNLKYLKLENKYSLAKELMATYNLIEVKLYSSCEILQAAHVAIKLPEAQLSKIRENSYSLNIRQIGTN